MEEDDRSVPESPILPPDKVVETGKRKEIIHSPMHSVTAPTSPLPTSASTITNSKFLSSRNDHNGKVKSLPVNIFTYLIFSYFFPSCIIARD